MPSDRYPSVTIMCISEKLYELKEEGILYMKGWTMRTRVSINLSRCHLLVTKGEGRGGAIVLGDPLLHHAANGTSVLSPLMRARVCLIDCIVA